MKMSFGCELAYRVKEPTVFVLQVEAARIASHGSLTEVWQMVPELQRDSAIVPLTENRTARFVTPAGALTVAYSGSVDLHTHRADPATIGEIAPAKLPVEVLPFLLPSRYCESDGLGDFVKEHFGALLPVTRASPRSATGSGTTSNIEPAQATSIPPPARPWKPAPAFAATLLILPLPFAGRWIFRRAS